MTDRLFVEDTLVIATHNFGKMQEIRLLFDKFNFATLSATDLGLPEPDETESSLLAMLFLKQEQQHFPQVMRHSLTTLACQLPGLEELLEYTQHAGLVQTVISILL